MKITKYPQSCVLIETKEKKILIDPGKYVVKEDVNKFDNINLVLLTHRHSDHSFSDYLKIIKENNPGVLIIGNSDISDSLKNENVKIEIVEEGDVKEFDNLKVEVVKAIHGRCPDLETNGFIVDDGSIRAYHCGDSLDFDPDFKANVIFVPICGGVVMEPNAAIDFCKLFEPKLVIPIHYDSELHPIGTEKFEEEVKKTDLKYKILKNKESIEIR